MPQDAEPFRLIAPPHTPMHADGRLNLAVVDKQAKLFSGFGIDAVFVAGSTGEGQSLTTSERMALTESWITAGTRHELPVIVHVGHNAQAEACRMASHACKAGATAVSALCSYYFKPTSVAELVDYCRPIAEAAGECPFYYYHIPALTGVQIPMAPFLAEAMKLIPNFAGIKYTDRNLIDLQHCMRIAGDDYEILFGWDEALLAGLALGVRGAIGSTYNFLAPLYRKLINAADAGQIATARQLQCEANTVIDALQSVGYLRAAKSLMQLLGCPCGPTRPPVTPLTADEEQTLINSVRSHFGIESRPLPIPEPHINMAAYADVVDANN
jgi:N-acetylneuraminate lyase